MASLHRLISSINKQEAVLQWRLHGGGRVWFAMKGACRSLIRRVDYCDYYYYHHHRGKLCPVSAATDGNSRLEFPRNCVIFVLLSVETSKLSQLAPDEKSNCYEAQDSETICRQLPVASFATVLPTQNSHASYLRQSYCQAIARARARAKGIAPGTSRGKWPALSSFCSFCLLMLGNRRSRGISVGQ